MTNLVSFDNLSYKKPLFDISTIRFKSLSSTYSRDLALKYRSDNKIFEFLTCFAELANSNIEDSVY